MEQSSSLYEDGLHFYLIIDDDGGLSAIMHFARVVRIHI